MKECYTCKTTKDDSEFYTLKSGRLSSSCRHCNREYRKRHYEANKADYIRRKKVNSKIREKAAKEYVVNYLKSHPCVDCGETDIVCLEFDHLRDKKDSICNMIRGRYSLEAIKKEIEKCEVRCSNCHARKTAKDFSWWILNYS